jgi:hypothetical protein
MIRKHTYTKKTKIATKEAAKKGKVIRLTHIILPRLPLLALGAERGAVEADEGQLL